MERAEGGEGIEVGRRDEPAVQPVPPRQSNGFASLFGCWQGRVRIDDDFDELPADLAEALGVES